MIKVTEIQTDGHATSTGPLMRHMVYTYCDDMLPWASLTLPEVYDIIKNIPFREDLLQKETLMRPLLTMTRRGWGGDCDDKCIALASWCYLNGGRANMGEPGKNNYDWRFVAVRRSDMPKLHHVLCEIYLYNYGFIHADPTYSFNTLGQPREHYEQRVII